MVAGARTFRIEETLLDPPALNPPPTRHALFAFVIALAVLLHIGTTGWGDLYSETDGQYAGAAREMIHSHQWLLPTNDGIPRLQKPPLLYWLIASFYKIFGVKVAVARLPIALAVVATTALTFLIGERLRDHWHGFVARLIYLCSCGTFLLGRIIMPEPVFSTFRGGRFFLRDLRIPTPPAPAALVRRSLDLRSPRLPDQECARTCLPWSPPSPSRRFSIARPASGSNRFSRWPYLLLFLALVLPWYFGSEEHFPGPVRPLCSVSIG